MSALDLSGSALATASPSFVPARYRHRPAAERGTRSVSITAELHRRITTAAAVRGMTRSELVEVALDGLGGARVVRVADDLGDAIRALRFRRGWTQQQLAGQVGIRMAHTISSWETGHARPQRRYLARLVALGLKLPQTEPPVVPPPPPRTSNEEDGAAVRAWRVGRGWNLTRLGAESGVALSTLSRIENGRARLTEEVRGKLERIGFECVAPEASGADGRP